MTMKKYGPNKRNSLMFQNLSKPIILTGSQLPLGQVRTDGKENLITAIEIASMKRNKKAIIQEVAIYFENQLTPIINNAAVEPTTSFILGVNE